MYFLSRLSIVCHHLVNLTRLATFIRIRALSTVCKHNQSFVVRSFIRTRVFSLLDYSSISRTVCEDGEIGIRFAINFHLINISLCYEDRQWKIIGRPFSVCIISLLAYSARTNVLEPTNWSIKGKPLRKIIAHPPTRKFARGELV